MTGEIEARVHICVSQWDPDSRLTALLSTQVRARVWATQLFGGQRDAGETELFVTVGHKILRHVTAVERVGARTASGVALNSSRASSTTTCVVRQTFFSRAGKRREGWIDRPVACQTSRMQVTHLFAIPCYLRLRQTAHTSLRALSLTLFRTECSDIIFRRVGGMRKGVSG